MKRKHLVPLPTKAIAKRTTIYLPTFIHLTKPTNEINHALNKLKDLFMHDSQMIDLSMIYHIFHPITNKQMNTKAYQIIIDDVHRNHLIKLRQQTGLTIGELIMYCLMSG